MSGQARIVPRLCADFDLCRLREGGGGIGFCSRATRETNRVIKSPDMGVVTRHEC